LSTYQGDQNKEDEMGRKKDVHVEKRNEFKILVGKPE
jgi:hypothetical protein